MTTIPRATAAMLLLVLISLGPVSILTSTGQEQGRPLLTDDGLFWSNPQRITFDPTEDSEPQLVVDAKGDSHIIWQRSGSYVYKKVDPQGNELIAEKVLASNANRVTSGHTDQPNPSIGIDSKGEFHIVYQVPFEEVNYEKYDSVGNRLCGPLGLEAGQSMSQGAAIGVASNDNAYVIFDYYPGPMERVALTMIDPRCRIIKHGIDVSEPAWYVEGATMTIDWDDNLRAVMNVWEGDDLGQHHSLLNKLGIRPSSIPTQFIKETHGMALTPRMATTPDGHAHLVYAQQLDWGNPTPNGELTYVELDERGIPIEGIAPKIVLTSDTEDYGSIVGDSRDSVYAFWTDAADKKLNYVKIEPGRENDVLQPVELTQGIGFAKNAMVAIDPNDNLHVVWQDSRDGNSEIYYQFALNFGVELDMDPAGIADMLFVRPDEHKTAEVRVKNLGGTDDTVTLTLATDHRGHEADGWEAWIEEDVLELVAQEAYTIDVHVKGPLTGQPGDFISVSLSAVTAGNPFKNETITFDTYLVVDHHLGLDVADSIHVVAAGEQTEYVLGVTNEGDVVEDVALEAVTQSDWTASVSDIMLEDMLPGETRSVILYVRSAPDAFADEIGLTTVEGWLLDYPSIRDTAVTHTIVAQSLQIDLDLEDPQHQVLPGESTSYTVAVSNTGNVQGKALVILEIVSGSGEWVAELSVSTLTIGAGEHKDVELLVTAPIEGLAGQRLVTRVVGTNDVRTQQDEVTATTIIGALHDVSVVATPTTKEANQGEKVVYALAVSNHGNGEEVLELTLDEAPVGWVISYLRSGATLSTLTVAAGSQATLSAEVDVAPDALAGPYAIKGKMVDAEGNGYQVHLITVVRQTYGVDLTTTLSRQVGAPGGSQFFTALVKNVGNGPDTFGLSLRSSTLPEDARVVFRDAGFLESEVLALGPAASGHMSVQVVLPGKLQNEDQFQFEVQARSHKSGKVDSVSFVIDVALPNLVLSKATYSPASLTAGKAVTVSIEVLSEGTIDVENVTVRFYDGGTIVGSERLDRLPGATNKTVSFTWIPQKQAHTLKFWVDPDQQIAETDETDNVMKETHAVRGGAGIPGFEAVAAVLALSLAAVVARRLQRVRA